MVKSKKNYNFTYTASFTSKIIKPKNIKELKQHLSKSFTIIGNMRSYGDTFIGSGNHISLSNFNQILNLDIRNKIIEIEAGASLREMNDKIFNEGLILQCMPGCKYVSIGGMIANNISGKLLINNKIENFIQSFKLINNKKQVIECSRKKNKKLFYLTIGGKGRTGPIISAKIKLNKLNSSLIKQETLYFDNYNVFFELLIKSKKFKYGVCWVDFTKENFEGILFLGSHYNSRDKNNFYFKEYTFPNFITYIISIFVKMKFITIIFNYFFKMKNKIVKKNILKLNNFFFPQNKIINWNNFFKPQGFYQFQIYLNRKNLPIVIDKIKKMMKTYKIFSNFSIIKFHNNKINNFNKFSLSLDFPICNNKKSIKKLINNIVSQNNLEVELSKDIALNKLNNSTLVKNDIFKQNNKMYFNKNFNSNIFKRLSKHG